MNDDLHTEPAYVLGLSHLDPTPMPSLTFFPDGEYWRAVLEKNVTDLHAQITAQDAHQSILPAG